MDSCTLKDRVSRALISLLECGNPTFEKIVFGLVVVTS